MGGVWAMAMGHFRVWERFCRIFWPRPAFLVSYRQEGLLAPSPMWARHPPALDSPLRRGPAGGHCASVRRTGGKLPEELFLVRKAELKGRVIFEFELCIFVAAARRHLRYCDDFAEHTVYIRSSIDYIWKFS